MQAESHFVLAIALILNTPLHLQQHVNVQLIEKLEIRQIKIYAD